MLELKNVVAGYGKEIILQGVDLIAEKGTVTTIVGRNGCGKSTLLKAVMGFLPLQDGDILLDGLSVRTLSRQELAQKVAYLPQGKNIPDITAGRLVLHGRFPYLHYPRKYSKTDIFVAQQAMDQLGISDLAEKPMAALSGGMRQKVYIAMALAQQAPVLVMDEPTTYLDIGQQMQFAEMVKGLSNSGKTVILVLHDIALALKNSHRIAVLEAGKINAVGTPAEILRAGVFPALYGIDVRAVQGECGPQYYYEMP